MKQTPIKYKVSFARLEILKDVLFCFADSETVRLVNARSRDIQAVKSCEINISVASQLFYRYQDKLTKRYPNEHYKLKFELHEAIILEFALVRYIHTTENLLRKNTTSIMRNDINQLIVSSKN